MPGEPNIVETLDKAAARIEALEAQLAQRDALIARAREALEPFSAALGSIADTDLVRFPDDCTLEYSGAPEQMTWADLRHARQVLKELTDGQ